MPKGKRTNKVSDNNDNWMYHIYHLASDIAFSRDCDICNYTLSEVNMENRGKFQDIKDDIIFYNEAVKSGKRVITFKEKLVQLKENQKTCQKTIS